MACATVFPSDTVISTRLSDLASIITADVWVMIKALELIKDSVASQHILLLQTHFRVSGLYSI